MIGEESYQALFDLAPDAMFILDQDRVIREINQIAYRQLGYTKAGMIGRYIGDFVPPEFASLLQSRFSKIQDQGYLIYESAMLRKDGSVLPVEISNRPIKWDGQPAFFAVVRDISERKRIESLALKSETKWRHLFENMTTGFALHDVICNTQGQVIDYRFIEINPAYELLTGLQANKIIGRTVLEVLPGTESYWIDTFGRVALTGEPTSYENYSKELERWYQVRTYSPKLGQFAVIVSDITERKLIEQTLLKSERDLNQAQALAHIGSWTHDLAGQITWSDECYRIFGFSPETFTPNREEFYKLIHPDDRPAMQLWNETCMSGQDPGPLEWRCIRADGSIRYILGHGTLVTDADGKTMHMAGTVQDITERKKDREALEAALEFSNNLISSMQDGFSVLDMHGFAQDANLALCQMTGFSREELIGLNAPFPYWPPEEYANIQAAFNKTLAGETGAFELTFMRKSGERFPVIVSPSAVKNSKGDIVSYIATVKDISALKQAEADLRISATAFESQESLMITDADGVILRVNKAFTDDTGYTAEEVVGQTPRLLKSGRHDANFYQKMWEIITRTGTWQGEIWDRRKNGDLYPKWLTISAVKREDGVVTHYVGSHFDITERKAAEEKIQHLAFYDHLTDLPNRLLLLDRLQQALVTSARSSRNGALLFIDLDNFKNLNDTLGHDMGDLLLKQVTQRLEACIREGDTMARLGGDEFVVMLVGLSEHRFEAAAQTEAIGEKMLAALSQPYQLDKSTYHCTGSIGITLLSGNQQAAEELMKQADIAMYQAKKAGRNTLRFFDQKMQENISARVSLEGELHKALEFQQFHLHYQIQVDNSLRPLGAEALIRWIHPERGMVSPAHFIPLAEENGLILPIGLWVLETACNQLKTWQKDALTRELTLAVNVSARQFRQGDFVAQVQAAVQSHAINPQKLKLELTESMLLENIEDTIATMKSLHEIGVQFSLDDFGTGYSSLQYLKRLQLDQLKIDQSFVRDIATNSSDKAIVRTIVAMAQSLDIDVIAEGVETEEQRQLLLKKGCSNYQGYLFGRPMPIDQFEASLKQT